jgi:hypothetical protein
MLALGYEEYGVYSQYVWFTWESDHISITVTQGGDWGSFVSL